MGTTCANQQRHQLQTLGASHLSASARPRRELKRKPICALAACSRKSGAWPENRATRAASSSGQCPQLPATGRAHQRRGSSQIQRTAHDGLEQQQWKQKIVHRVFSGSLHFAVERGVAAQVAAKDERKSGNSSWAKFMPERIACRGLYLHACAVGLGNMVACIEM